MPTLVTRLVLAGNEEEVPRARHAVIDQARAWGVPMDDETADAVRIVASELITNAVIHGEGPITVALHHWPGRLAIDVLDSSSAAPQMGCAEVGDESGRGLELVALLTAKLAWGPCTGGKRVWAEIALRNSAAPIRAAVQPRLSAARPGPDSVGAPGSPTPPPVGCQRRSAAHRAPH